MKKSSASRLPHMLVSHAPENIEELLNLVNIELQTTPRTDKERELLQLLLMSVPHLLKEPSLHPLRAYFSTDQSLVLEPKDAHLHETARVIISKRGETFSLEYDPWSLLRTNTQVMEWLAHPLGVGETPTVEDVSLPPPLFALHAYLLPLALPVTKLREVASRIEQLEREPITDIARVYHVVLETVKSLGRVKTGSIKFTVVEEKGNVLHLPKSFPERSLKTLTNLLDKCFTVPVMIKTVYRPFQRDLILILSPQGEESKVFARGFLEHWSSPYGWDVYTTSVPLGLARAHLYTAILSQKWRDVPELVKYIEKLTIYRYPHTAIATLLESTFPDLLLEKAKGFNLSREDRQFLQDMVKFTEALSELPFHA